MNKLLLVVIVLLLGLIIEHEYGLIERLDTSEAQLIHDEEVVMLSNMKLGEYKKDVINKSTTVLHVPVIIIGNDTLYKKITVKYLNHSDQMNNPLTPSTWYIMEGN
jgi:hypothetical protein